MDVTQQKENMPSLMYVSIFLKSGPRAARGARRRECPKRFGFGPGGNWRWRCWTSAEPSCRTPGLRGTKRWDVPAVFRVPPRLRSFYALSPDFFSQVIPQVA
jgi:hypothetical protein